MLRKIHTTSSQRATQEAASIHSKKSPAMSEADQPPHAAQDQPAATSQQASTSTLSPSTTKYILAEHIGYSHWNTRHASSFMDEEFLNLKADIARVGGNVQPVKVRHRNGASLLKGKVETYELVFGHRRHQGCMQLGLPVLAIIEEVSDEQLIAEMLSENENRKTLAAWELGELFQRLLDEKCYTSQTALAQALQRDEGDVSRALQVRAIPEEILAVIETPTGFALHDGSKISKALKDDLSAVMTVVSGLASEARKATAKEFMKLIAKKPGPKPKCPCEEIGASKTDDVSVHLTDKEKEIVRSLRHENGTQTIQIQQAMSLKEQAFIGKMVALFVQAMASN
ncbi:MAG TPA: ParB/RepB/Spo0J family partition protein [Terriglobales bacterium]|jgi:ParB/RepB/Spo0J family partition protein|nr:ParB/RepB/Spo0J family partition protein [Terriglobales bacterium]